MRQVALAWILSTSALWVVIWLAQNHFLSRRYGAQGWSRGHVLVLAAAVSACYFLVWAAGRGGGRFSTSLMVDMPTQVSLTEIVATAAMVFMLTVVALVSALCDARVYRIPTPLMHIGIAIAASIYVAAGQRTELALASVLSLLIYVMLRLISTKTGGYGMGDVRLATVIVFGTGFFDLSLGLVCVLVAALSDAIFRLVHWVLDRSGLNRPQPHGVFLAMSLCIVLALSGAVSAAAID